MFFVVVVIIVVIYCWFCGSTALLLVFAWSWRENPLACPILPWYGPWSDDIALQRECPERSFPASVGTRAMRARRRCCCCFVG